ncbi:MAG: tRNA dihydrouridine synthase DusB [Magnetococcales bacterium]|nr:tRNA dihydrouridine synthase DusB [Magnetococcales bacterium]
MPHKKAIHPWFANKNGTPLLLAPMAGVTDGPFRLLAQRMGADLTISEMVASQAMVRQTKGCREKTTSLEREMPLAVQIAGADPEVMAKAARMHVDLGAGMIDINMGCPVRKIIKGGAGAALMRDECLAGRIMEQVVKAVPVPVTIKIRLGWDAEHLNGLQIARIAEASGIHWLTVHGRTRAQMYNGQADWAQIAEIKRQISIPVIGNGDITTPAVAARCLADSGVDALMIGRGALGRPWIFRQIDHHLRTGSHWPDPPLAERFQVARDHFESLLTFHGPVTGNLLARKHLAWYSRGLSGSATFRQEINHTVDATATRDCMQRFFATHLDAEA